MPPLAATQVNETGITSWSDVTTNSKRSQVLFPDSDRIQVAGSTAATAIRLTGLAIPTDAQDATNKAYVDAAIQGLVFKAPARLGRLTDVDLSTLVVGYAFDQTTENGVTTEFLLAAGDRILLMGQTNGGLNGLWQVASTGPPTRPLDFGGGSQPTRASGTYVFVDQGSLMDRAFVCITDRDNDVVGTAPNLEFVQFSARQSAMAGFGLVVGQQMELDVDGTVIPYLAATENVFTGIQNAPRVTGLVTGSITGNSDAVNLEFLNNRHYAAPYKYPVDLVLGWNVPDPAVALVSGTVLANGFSLAAEQRLLLLGQTATAENGIWVVGASAATRALDMPLNAVVERGTLLPERSGRLFVVTATAVVGSAGQGLQAVVQHGTEWRAAVRCVVEAVVANPAADLVVDSNGACLLPSGETVVVGDRVLLVHQSQRLHNDVWTVAADGETAALAADSADTRTGSIVADAAGRIWVCQDDAAANQRRWLDRHADHKAAVRRALAYNVPAPATALVEGFAGLLRGDRVLLLGQTNAVECGLWVVAATGATAVRSLDMAPGARVEPATTVADVDGTLYVYHGPPATAGTDDLAAWTAHSGAWIPPVRYVFDHPVTSPGTALVCDVTGTLTGVPGLGTTALQAGDRVLLTQQTDPAERVVWVVAPQGQTAGRTADLPAATRNGAVVFDRTGRAFVCQAPTSTSVVWVENSRENTVKMPVVAASTVDVGDPFVALRGSLTLDGTSVGQGQRVLLKDQTDATQNGIWLVGDANVPAIRAPDLAYGTPLYGATVLVLSGVRYRMTTWMAQPAALGVLVGQGAAPWVAIHTQSASTVRSVRVAAVYTVADPTQDLVDGAVLDGVTLVAGDRVLLRAQTDGVQNGIWVVGAVDGTTGLLQPAPVRAPDFAAGQPCTGAHIWVAEGDLHGASQWTCVTPSAEVGTTALVFRCLDAEHTYYKAAVAVATTRAIGTLATGLTPGASVDGVTVTKGMRVLVKDQTDAVENGIYVVDSPPVRALDLRVGTAAGGITVPVLGGTVNPNSMWVCSAGSADRVGQHALPFRSPVVDAINGGVFKEAVHVASVADVPSLLTTLVPGYVLDGVVLTAGMRVLIRAQTTAAENGIYLVTTGEADRTADMAPGAACAGAAVMVLGGTMAGQLMVCRNLLGADVVGTDGLTFQSLYLSAARNDFVGVLAAPRLTGLSTAAITDNSDAVNLEFLTQQQNASVYKEAVVLAIHRYVANPATTLVATLQGGQPLLLLDGEALRPGQRVLLTGQPLSDGMTVTENGIWIVAAPGATAARAPDYEPSLADPRREAAVVLENGGDRAGASEVYVGSQFFWHRMRTDANSVYKDPVRVATTQALASGVLMAGFVVDGVTLASGDRVLVKDQSVSADNGIWVVGSTGALRAVDLRPEYPWDGVTVEVTEGLTQANTRWRVATGYGPWQCISGGDLPWKGAVRAAGNANVDLTSLLAGYTLDGVLLAQGDRVLLMGQTAATENGVWVVGDGSQPARRASDLVDGRNAGGACAYVLLGTVHQRQAFVCSNAPGSDVVGVAGLVFEPLLNHDIVPWLHRTNAFTGANSFAGTSTFSGPVTVSNATLATSQTTGAVVVAGGIGVAGDVFCSSTYNMSDERLKQDFRPLGDDALGIIDAIRGYEFRWKEGDDDDMFVQENKACQREGPSVGVKAQELQTAGAALCVSEDQRGILAVDYTKLVPYLIESVRTLKRRVEELEAPNKRAKCAED